MVWKNENPDLVSTVIYFLHLDLGYLCDASILALTVTQTGYQNLYLSTSPLKKYAFINVPNVSQEK